METISFRLIDYFMSHVWQMFLMKAQFNLKKRDNTEQNILAQN